MSMEQGLSRDRYVLQAALWIGFLAVATLAFPLFVGLVVRLSGSANGANVSTAVGGMMNIYVRPLIYLVFCLAMLFLGMQRAAALGMNPVIGAAITATLLGDTGYGIAFGSQLNTAEALGVAPIGPPWLFSCALIALLTLGILHDRDKPTRAGRHFGGTYVAWLLCLSVLMLAALTTVMQGVLLYGHRVDIVLSLRPLWSLYGFVAAPYSAAIFAGLSLWLIVVDRKTMGPMMAPKASPKASIPPGRVVFSRKRAES